MFDISMSELTVCFVVALVVLGPERLPKLARTLGRWSGQARAYMRNFTSELERETQVIEIKKQLQDARRILDESANSVRRSVSEVARDADVRGELAEVDRPPGPTTPPPPEDPGVAHDAGKGLP
jgi:sec-independent protein translocase protein TatB